MEIDPEKSIEIMDTLEISTTETQQQQAINKLQLPQPQQLEIESTGSFSNDLEMSESADSKDDQCRSEATFSYTIDNIATLKTQQLSPPVYVRMLPWRIMVIPNERALGFFLQCNGENDSPSWTCHATAELRLKCHKPDAPAFTRARIKHLFYAKENDYGYSNFITWQELQEPDKHYVNNGSLTLEVHVVADAPHGVLWDSKKHTGFVGLKNQGATCYMNSLLQTLYFTNQLRSAVYKIPTEADDSAKSVGLSLQRVFHELQFSDRPAGTKKLTKSFGWETLDSFMQHDVQEFLRVLLDKLETKMKGTILEGTIPGLFEGKMSSYIKCKNVDYNSTRYETFYDIQLNIKDKKTIYDSFSDYIASETLEGDNKYDAGEHGLQEASKGVIFTKFPPVLHLHLMRFQYDPITDNSIKYNDRFEFYDTINLDPYLAEKESTPADYVLHAVLVHSGDNHGGHYVVFINVKADGKWFKFDDDVVSSSRKDDAVNQNYGGMDDDLSFHAKCSNAYMLVYIRKSELGRILAEITENEIPSELIERFELEKRIEMARRKERSEINLYVTIHVILEEYFEPQQKRQLFDLVKAHPRIFKMKQTQTVGEMVETFANTFFVPKERFRIWVLCAENLQTQNFVYFDYQREAQRTIDQIATIEKPWVIFLELVAPDIPELTVTTFDGKEEMLLFFKYYDAKNKRLNYLGCSTQSIHRKFIDLIPEINEQLGFDLNTKLTIFDECNDLYIENLSETLSSLYYNCADSLQGFILVFERDDVDINLDLPTVEDYFTDLVYRCEVTFCDKANPNEPEIVLELSNRYTYDQMAHAVAERLNTDPNMLQFFMCVNSYKGQPGNSVPYTYKGTLRDLVFYNNRAMKKLFYQRLTLNIHELDSKKPFNCVWVSYDTKEEKGFVLYPNKDENVKALLDEAASKIQYIRNVNRKKLRLLKVSNHKIMSIIKDDTPLDLIQKSNENMQTTHTGQKIYRIEEIPLDEMELADNEMLIPVVHCSKDVYNTFGTPFLMKMRQGELYGDVKQRIQKRLNVHDKEWEHFKFFICAMGHTNEVYDKTPVDLDAYRMWSNSQVPFFGLDHINKSRKRTALNFSEKAIKIYN